MSLPGASVRLSCVGREAQDSLVRAIKSSKCECRFPGCKKPNLNYTVLDNGVTVSWKPGSLEDQKAQRMRYALTDLDMLDELLRDDQYTDSNKQLRCCICSLKEKYCYCGNWLARMRRTREKLTLELKTDVESLKTSLTSQIESSGEFSCFSPGCY